MNKKGFVFVESIVVLVVVALSLAMMISSYSLVSRKTKEKEYYNRASDKYLLYSISNLATDDKCNYGISCENEDVSFRADRDPGDYNCENTKIGDLMYHCSEVFREMELYRVYVIENVDTVLKDSNSVSLYDSGTLEYLKTLKRCNDRNENDDYSDYKNSQTCEEPITYMVGVFERGENEYYYAAIEVGISYESGLYRCPVSTDCTMVYSNWTKETERHGDYDDQCTSESQRGGICGKSKSGTHTDQHWNQVCNVGDVIEVISADPCQPCNNGSSGTGCSCGCGTCYTLLCQDYTLNTCTVYNCPTTAVCEYEYGDYQATKYGPKQDKCIKD